jgi:hypothetical protein
MNFYFTFSAKEAKDSILFCLCVLNAMWECLLCTWPLPTRTSANAEYGNNIAGPLPRSFMRAQWALQKRILARYRELAITGQLPAFQVRDSRSKKYCFFRVTVTLCLIFRGFSIVAFSALLSFRTVFSCDLF